MAIRLFNIQKNSLKVTKRIYMRLKKNIDLNIRNIIEVSMNNLHFLQLYYYKL